MKIRKSKDRGFFDHGWLKTFHTFSFADYFDENFRNFSSLCVINEDCIEAAQGFSTHGHRDMEIITYPISGSVAHKDSTGGEGLIRPGEVQRMSAGTGIRHSEFNGEQFQRTHLYQIWILPEHLGLKPSYEQKDFSQEIAMGDPVLLVAPNTSGALKIHQDVELWVCRPKQELQWKPELGENRKFWIQVVKGEIHAGGQVLGEGDGAYGEVTDLPILVLKMGSEVLLFNLK